MAVNAHRRAVTALRFTPAGSLLSGDSRGWLAHWDGYGCLWSRRLARRGITAIANHGADEIVLGSFDGAIVQCALQTGAMEVLSRVRRGVAAIAYNAHTDRTIVTTRRGEISIYDGERPVISERIEQRGPAYCSVRPDARSLLVWGSGSRLEVRSATSLELIDAVHLETLTISDVRADDGDLLYVLDYERRLRAWVQTSWVQVAELELGVHGVARCIGRIGNMLWIVVGDTIVRVNAQRFVVADAQPFDALTAVAVDPVHERVALGFRTGIVQVWRQGDDAITEN